MTFTWRQVVAALTAAVGLTGCGGYYTVTAPDQITPAGDDAPIVVRLQRDNFDVADQAWKDAPVQFRIGDGPSRFAYTDDQGYAATVVPAPEAPGRYVLEIHYQDQEGNSVTAHAPVYVWDPDDPVVAVDADSLPLGILEADRTVAKHALTQVGGRAAVIYLSRKDMSEFAGLRQEILGAGLPDGPLLPWRREYYRMVRGRWGMPRMIFGSHLVSQLVQLKSRFPNLQMGITGSTLSAEEFAGAGLTTYMLGDAADPGVGRVNRSSWQDLASRAPRELARAPRRGPILQGAFPPRRRPVRAAPVGPTAGATAASQPPPSPPDRTPPPVTPPDGTESVLPLEGPLPDRPPRQPVRRADDAPVDLRDLPARG